MTEVDELDLKILTELSNDSSITVLRLAEKINTNSSLVYSRIKRLVKRKMIERFTIIVNNSELGYTVKAFTGINIDAKKRDSIVDKLFKIDGVRDVSEVAGRFDILVTMYARSLDQMHTIVATKIGSIDGVRSSESFIEMKSHARAIPYMLPGSSE